ncbi:MAG: type II toxin-antitoxin system PemK/MazF family toxin [Nocardioidaceae bacterium]
MQTSYAPEPDGHADPGEVVWAWVPYEDDPAQGKDRPVLVIGRDGEDLLGLYLTSKDHDRDADDEARYGRYWMDVGSGGWDSRHRPSEIRLDRLLRLRESGVRREGSALDRPVFDAVVRAAREHHAL